MAQRGFPLLGLDCHWYRWSHRLRASGMVCPQETGETEGIIKVCSATNKEDQEKAEVAILSPPSPCRTSAHPLCIQAGVDSLCWRWYYHRRFPERHIIAESFCNWCLSRGDYSPGGVHTSDFASVNHCKVFGLARCGTRDIRRVGYLYPWQSIELRSSYGNGWCAYLLRDCPHRSVW